MCNRTCSAGTQKVTRLIAEKVNIIMQLSKSISGQLGNLGLFERPRRVRYVQPPAPRQRYSTVFRFSHIFHIKKGLALLDDFEQSRRALSAADAHGHHHVF